MKEDRFSILCSIWNKIGPFNMDRFSDRLILQKKIFLLQEMGCNLGYNFTKYIYGPYSTVLTNDGFKVNLMNSSRSNGESSVKEFLKKLKQLEEGHEGDVAWFELLGTIAYLRNKMNKSKDEIRRVIEEEKPYLERDNLFEEAYSILLRLNIISN